MDKTFITADDVAKILNCSRGAIYQRIHRKDFPDNTFVRFGKRRILFIKEELMNFILAGAAILGM